jgi:hypothetical protein
VQAFPFVFALPSNNLFTANSLATHLSKQLTQMPNRI